MLKAAHFLVHMLKKHTHTHTQSAHTECCLCAGCLSLWHWGCGDRHSVWMIQAADLFVLCLHQLIAWTASKHPPHCSIFFRRSDQQPFSTNRSKQHLLRHIRCVYSILLVLSNTYRLYYIQIYCFTDFSQIFEMTKRCCLLWWSKLLIIVVVSLCLYIWALYSFVFWAVYIPSSKSDSDSSSFPSAD